MIQLSAEHAQPYEEAYFSAFGGMKSLFLSGGGRPVQVFSSWAAVVAHIRKHMLSPDEIGQWMQVAPGLGACIGPDVTANALEGISRRLESDGELLRDLYRHYVNTIDRAMTDAIQNDWITTNGSSVFAVGLSGLFVVLSGGVVRTAYFPSASRSSSVPGVGGRGKRGVYKTCFKPTLRFIGAFESSHSGACSQHQQLYRSLARKINKSQLCYGTWRCLHGGAGSKAAA